MANTCRLGSGGGGRQIVFAPVFNVDARTDKAEILSILDRGMQAAQAHDGFDAIEVAQRARREGVAPHVALIDWRMPQPDGVQTLLQLRELLGAGMPPSVLVTAFDDTAMWQQARQAQAEAADPAALPPPPQKARPKPAPRAEVRISIGRLAISVPSSHAHGSATTASIQVSTWYCPMASRISGSLDQSTDSGPYRWSRYTTTSYADRATPPPPVVVNPA